MYRLQIDSVADIAGQFTDSIQLAEIEPIYSAKEDGSAAAAYGLVVSAQGEHPLMETCDRAFDGDPTTKWLDFANGHTNRSSWIQWQYVRDMPGLVVNLNRLRTTPHQSSQAVKLDLRGVVVYRNANDLGILDETGCAMVRLRSRVEAVQCGERISVKGGLQFGRRHTAVSNPELVALGELAQVDEIQPGQAFPDGSSFLLAPFGAGRT